MPTQEQLARRIFLKQLSAASAAALACSSTRAWAQAEAVTQPTAKADSCILIWMAGGMAIGGLRPIVEIMFGDFVMLGADQLLNHLVKS